MNKPTTLGPAQIGDHVLWHRCLMTIVDIREWSANRTFDDPYIELEYEDAGGIKWRYKLRPDDLSIKRLGKTEDQVLDSIVLATESSKSSYDELKDETARRFANPRPGDSFHEMFSWWLIIDQVKDDGSIVCRTSGRVDNGKWVWSPIIYSSADHLRKDCCYKDFPGYPVSYFETKKSNVITT